jgi:DNA-binding XRE family transcriptional regulator
MTSAQSDEPTGAVIPDWTFADRMRKIRRDVLGIEQGEMAEKLNVKKQAYAAWETGRTHPRDILAIARRVELATRVPAQWVLGLDQSPPPDGSRIKRG